MTHRDWFSKGTKLIESKEGVYTIQELEISKDNKILVQATYHKKNSFNIIKTIIVWDREVQERYSVLNDLKYDVNLSVTSYTKGKRWEEISTVDYVETDWNLDEEDADKFLKNNFKDAVSVFNKVVQSIAERSTE